MYQVSDRAMRHYREYLRKGQSFKIELKTGSGIVQIYSDQSGNATMQNSESGKFNLRLGETSQVLALIERNEALPILGSLDFATPVPTELGPAVAQVTGNPIPETVKETVESTQTEPIQTTSVEAKPTQTESIRAGLSAMKQRAPRVDTRDIPNARKVIAAALAGAAHLRAKRDVLKTLPNGKREWSFTRRRPVDGKWKVVLSETVAIFEPAGEFTCPHSEEPVVIRRQEMLKQISSKRGDAA